MCGIVGYIGKNNALPKLIQGLKKLEYRGYDSAGIAYITPDKKIKINKSVGRIANLEKKINQNEKTKIGIGHTRWATHGEVTENNSHPHNVGNITIVHNGILENYQELKKILIKEGYTFNSDTDTEVACCYIDYIYQKRTSDNIIDILSTCMNNFIGSYAIVGIIEGIENQLFVMKKDNPLIIATDKNSYYIASDISAFANCADSYISLGDLEYGIITAEEIKLYKNGKKIKPTIKIVDKAFQDSDKKNFEHYMLKEIYDQKDLVNNWNKYYLNEEALKSLPNINQFKKIHIIGCGTAYHAGMIGKYLLEKYGDIEVQVFIASEYRYQKLFIDKKTLVIAISQSGETADTLACIKRVKEYKVHTLGIVNVEDSSIARIVDEVIYTKAGQEIAVASTKAYTAQVYVLGILSLKLGLTNQKLNLIEVKKSYSKLKSLIENAIHYHYNIIVDSIWNKNNIFFLGRNIDYVTMMEGSLKLKEISYIHSEAMAAGELKHGTISLTDESSCVLVMATLEQILNKTISNIKEVKARGARVILLASEILQDCLDKDCYDYIIWVPKTIDLIQPIVNVIYLQMIAYEVAKKRGLDIDKPRNLAKSVTVE